MTFWDFIWGAKKTIWTAFGVAWTAFVAIVAALPPGAGLDSIPLIAWLGIVSALLGVPGGTYFFKNRQAGAKEDLEQIAADLLKVAQEAVK